MAKKDELFSKKFVEDLFGGSNHTLSEDRVREYVIHRVKNGGAPGRCARRGLRTPQLLARGR